MAIAQFQAYFTIKEVALLLRVQPITIRRWLSTEYIKGVRLGNGGQSGWRIPHSEILRILNIA